MNPRRPKLRWYHAIGSPNETTTVQAEHGWSRVFRARCIKQVDRPLLGASYTKPTYLLMATEPNGFNLKFYGTYPSKKTAYEAAEQAHVEFIAAAVATALMVDEQL